jgi:SAM-dependent methyltransferase
VLAGKRQLDEEHRQAAEPALRLRGDVRDAYSRAAESPEGEHPFPVGCGFAESLGYPGALLQEIPAQSVDAFAGVSNISITAEIPRGATVLDLGCGAGLDSLIAARRVGPEGRVLGVDFSGSMIGRARRAAGADGSTLVEFLEAPAEELPIGDASADVALVNGLFNLNPARAAIFRELARVVRPGGSVYAAELILREPLPDHVLRDQSNWFA